MSKIENYNNWMRKDLNTGDIVLFSGKGNISNVIKWFTKSPWSHVGMVIKSTEWGMLLLWESTTLSKVKDIESGEARQGVMIVPLSKRITDYDGGIAIRKLNTQTVLRTEPLIKLREEVKGRPYEQSKLELFRSAYDWIGGGNQEDLSSVFCSELVAEAYQRLGLLSEDKPSNEYTPADFGGDIELINGHLEKEIYL